MMEERCLDNQKQETGWFARLDVCLFVSERKKSLLLRDQIIQTQSHSICLSSCMSYHVSLFSPSFHLACGDL